MCKLIASGLLFASMLMASQAAGEETLTAKERSSRTWFDEQRIDVATYSRLAWSP